MSQLSSLAQPYLDLQSLVRSISRDYASNLNWCRNPQNNDQKLGAYFKPRVNILIRPPLVKTGIARKLHAGGGEILFHIQGVFDDVGFLADPKYRVVCGNRCPMEF